MRETEGLIAFPLGLVAGAIVTLAPMVAFGSDAPDLTFALPAWVVCILGLSLLGPVWTGPVWAATGVGLALPAIVIARIVIDTAEDPTSHNLIPFEILSAVVISLLPATVGMLGGWVLWRRVRQKVRAAKILVVIGVLIAVGPVGFASAQMSFRERDALSRMEAILRAQRTHRSQDPAGRYACGFGELGQTFERGGSNPPYSEGGWANGYHFQILCRDGTGTMYSVGASPERLPRSDVRHSLGRIYYCIDEGGRLLSLSRHRGRNCWQDGEPVSEE